MSIENIYVSFCEYVQSINDLTDFKSNPLLKSILEHVSFAQGQEYLEHINLINQYTQEDIINYCKENDKYGNSEKFDYGFITTSPTNFRYILHSFLILKHLNELDKKEINIVEIGCGYGGLCLALNYFSKKMNITINNYYLIDLPDISNLQKLYLNNYSIDSSLHYHNAFNYGSDIDNNDLFLISNYCFSEISHENQQNYIKNLFAKISYGFMVWNHIPLYDFGFSYKEELEYPLTGNLNKYIYF